MLIQDYLALVFSSNSLVSVPKILQRVSTGAVGCTSSPPPLWCIYRAVLIDWLQHFFLSFFFFNFHSTVAGRVSLTIRSIWNRYEAPLKYAKGLPPLCCGYFEIFGKLGYKSHPIILSTLDSRSKVAELWTGNVEKSFLSCFVFVLPLLLADLEEMTECSCFVHGVGQSVLSDKVVTVK